MSQMNVPKTTAHHRATLADVLNTSNLTTSTSLEEPMTDNETCHMGYGDLNSFVPEENVYYYYDWLNES